MSGTYLLLIAVLLFFSKTACGSGSTGLNWLDNENYNNLIKIPKLLAVQICDIMFKIVSEYTTFEQSSSATCPRNNSIINTKKLQSSIKDAIDRCPKSADCSAVIDWEMPCQGELYFSCFVLHKSLISKCFHLKGS